jgi:hypothetical protein
MFGNIENLYKEGGESSNRSLQLGLGGDTFEETNVFDGAANSVTDATGGSNLLKGTQLSAAGGAEDQQINSVVNVTIV